jgi:hypothetical protein
MRSEDPVLAADIEGIAACLSQPDQPMDNTEWGATSRMARSTYSTRASRASWPG